MDDDTIVNVKSLCMFPHVNNFWPDFKLVHVAENVQKAPWGRTFQEVTEFGATAAAVGRWQLKPALPMLSRIRVGYPTSDALIPTHSLLDHDLASRIDCSSLGQIYFHSMLTEKSYREAGRE